MTAELTEIEAARALVLERVIAMPSEPVEVGSALGRVLAEDVTSAEPVPGFDNSAMDGYAVRAADTAGGAPTRPRLRVVDESRAGHPARAALGAGRGDRDLHRRRGPRGADAVVRVEDTDARRGTVEVRVRVEAGRDIRRAGDDIRAGETVIAAGTALGPAELGVLASVGRAAVACAVRPRVTVLTHRRRAAGARRAAAPRGDPQLERLLGRRRSRAGRRRARQRRDRRRRPRRDPRGDRAGARR